MYSTCICSKSSITTYVQCTCTCTCTLVSVKVSLLQVSSTAKYRNTFGKTPTVQNQIESLHLIIILGVTLFDLNITSDLPKLSCALCPAARVTAGTRDTPVTPSNAMVEPSVSWRNSPLRENAICPASRSNRQPTTSPALHLWPKLSLPLCHLHACMEEDDRKDTLLEQFQTLFQWSLQ